MGVFVTQKTLARHFQNLLPSKPCAYKYYTNSLIDYGWFLAESDEGRKQPQDIDLYVYNVRTELEINLRKGG